MLPNLRTRFNFLMWATISLRLYRLFITASDISQLILDCLKSFFTVKAMVLLLYGPVISSSGPNFDYSWQLHNHTFKGLGIRDDIETLPYLQNILTSR